MKLMLKPFVNQLEGLIKIPEFSYGVVIGEQNEIGNILGDYLLFHGLPIKDSALHHHVDMPDIICGSLFNYPCRAWMDLMSNHPDFDSTDEVQRAHALDKIIQCGFIWEHSGFIYFGSDESKYTFTVQKSNVLLWESKSLEEQIELQQAIMNVLFHSGF